MDEWMECWLASWLLQMRWWSSESGAAISSTVQHDSHTRCRWSSQQTESREMRVVHSTAAARPTVLFSAPSPQNVSAAAAAPHLAVSRINLYEATLWREAVWVQQLVAAVDCCLLLSSALLFLCLYVCNKPAAAAAASAQPSLTTLSAHPRLPCTITPPMLVRVSTFPLA